MIAREEVKTQDTPTITPQVTSVQPSPHLVVYQRKETIGFTTSTPMETNIVLVQVQEPKKDKVEIVGGDKVETLVNDGTPSQIG